MESQIVYKNTIKDLAEISPRHLISKLNSLQKNPIMNLAEINPRHLIGKLNSLQKKLRILLK